MARTLVRDAAGAEDLVQESWLAALRRPPKHDANLRAWLGRVVRRQALQKGRTESRRRAREEAAARPEATMEDLAQRASVQRDVVQHVLALDEPYRSAVLLRFFEDRKPPEIAERLGIPLKTVHSRLGRAFDKLRERLDAEYGNSQAWAALLLPFATQSVGTGAASAALSSPALPSMGGGSLKALQPLSIMNAQAKLAIAATVLLLGGWAAWKFSSNELAPVEGAAPTLAASEPTVESPNEIADLAAPLEAQRVPSSAASPTPEATDPDVVEASPDETLVQVRGRVLDVHGQAITGVAVRMESRDLASPVVTGGDGFFALDVRESPLKGLFNSDKAFLIVDDPGWVTLRRSFIDATNLNLDHLVIAARAGSVEGRVQDSVGAPIPGARLRMGVERDTFQDLDLPLDMTQLVQPTCTTDEDGQFAMSPFPELERLRLTVVAAGFVSASVSLDSASWPLVIELTRVEDSGEVMLEGFVVDANGQPAKGAAVQLGSSKTKSGDGGLFRLPIPRLSPTTPLCAAKPGSQPGLIPNFLAIVEEANGTPDPVELVLGGPTLSITGQVVDQAGAPCRGWIVSMTDETEISQYRVPIDSAEGLSRTSNSQVTTDSLGRFRVEGLMPRDYILQTYDKETLLRTEKTLPAGSTAVKLVVETSLVSRVEGQVVSLDGTPVPDVNVRLNLATSATSIGHTSIQGKGTVTDEEGRFVIEDVPERYAYLFLDGETILNGRHDLAKDVGAEPERVEVERRCHFQLELSDAYAGANDVWFEDGNGQRTQINRIEAGGMSAFSNVPMIEGKSQVLSVSEAATTLVLARNGEELGRMPVQLSGHEVTQLRP